MRYQPIDAQGAWEVKEQHDVSELLYKTQSEHSSLSTHRHLKNSTLRKSSCIRSFDHLPTVRLAFISFKTKSVRLPFALPKRTDYTPPLPSDHHPLSSVYIPPIHFG